LGCWWMTGNGNNISSAGLASMDVRSSWAASHKQATHQFGRKRVRQQGTKPAVDSKQEKGLLLHASHLTYKTSGMSRARWIKVELAVFGQRQDLRLTRRSSSRWRASSALSR
jgi:hypothetical protein